MQQRAFINKITVNFEIKTMKYRQTVYQFRMIEPAKRFSDFNYTELTWNEVVCGYCNKNEVLKINGMFFIYAGETHFDWNEKRNSIIRFKKRSKIINEITVL